MEKVKTVDEMFAEYKTGCGHFRKEVIPMGM